MKKKAIKILKSKIGLVSNSAFLINKDKFYLLDTDFYKIEEIPFNENELDEIKKQTKFIFSNVMKEVINSDDEYNYKPEINRLMKEIKIKLKN